MNLKALNTIIVPLFLLALAAGFGGCSSAPIDENDPAALLKDAEEDIASEHFLIALDKLRVIKNKFPYSKQALEAQLRMGDIYFQQESYPEAAVVYETFRDLHPKHPKAPYAVFRIGKSYYKDVPSSTARDMTSATKALESYTDFIHRFPNAPEAAEARKDISDVRQLLAEKELYIGEFYFKRDFYDSAKPRLKKVLELYPETPAAQTAKEILAKIENSESKGKTNATDRKSEP